PTSQLGAWNTTLPRGTKLPWNSFRSFELPRATKQCADLAMSLSMATCELSSTVLLRKTVVDCSSFCTDTDELSSKVHCSMVRLPLPSERRSMACHSEARRCLSSVSLGGPPSLRSVQCRMVTWPVHLPSERMRWPLPARVQGWSAVPFTSRTSSPV